MICVCVIHDDRFRLAVFSSFIVYSKSIIKCFLCIFFYGCPIQIFNTVITLNIYYFMTNNTILIQIWDKCLSHQSVDSFYNYFSVFVFNSAIFVSVNLRLRFFLSVLVFDYSFGLSHRPSRQYQPNVLSLRRLATPFLEAVVLYFFVVFFCILFLYILNMLKK